MPESVRAVRATVQIGNLTVDGFQLPDGSYRMSQTQAAECVDFVRKKRPRIFAVKNWIVAVLNWIIAVINLIVAVLNLINAVFNWIVAGNTANSHFYPPLNMVKRSQGRLDLKI